MNKFLLTCFVVYSVAWQSYAQEQSIHILPPEIKAERQAKGLLEDISRTPETFEFKQQLNPFDKSSVMDAPTWLPAEFEESDAVGISWNYNSATQIDTSGSLASISAQLCIHIQPEAKVFIRLNRFSDSVFVKRYMQRINQPLYNYQFVEKFLNAWWYRDFGPIGYYAGPNDSLIYNDFKYYLGRQHDDAMPATHAFIDNVGHRVTPMQFEGGNLITDGFGTVFYSDVVTQANTQPFAHYPSNLNAARVADSMRTVLQATRVNQLPALNCDGGTGHLDLYLKMFDEETWIAAQYPLSITASDRQLIENNVNFLRSLQSVYGRPYRIIRVPLPTDNNGGYNNQITCTQLNNFGRSFVNGITVNKSFIYPIWDSPGNGNTQQRLQFEAQLRRELPGYKLKGIDVRAMTGFGGQLHCITMQMPTANPVRFWHPAIRDAKPLLPEYNLTAKIKNKSGIFKAVCKWRKGTTGDWNELDLTDSAGFFVGVIPGTDLAVGDTVQYFLEAETNNGKVARKPIVAPEGYYQFYIENITSTTDLLKTAELTLYPNPTASLLQIAVNKSIPGQYDMVIRDLTGKLIRVIPLGYSSTNHFTAEANLATLPKGMYMAEIRLNGKMFANHKISKI